MQYLQPNTTLQGGKYRIERVLGQGGFGITYLAEQTTLHRYVAIKELFIGGEGQAINDRRGNMVVVTNPVNQASFNQQKEKFKKEAIRLANLNHPNLVKVHDMFEENGTAYYVMDYIEGESLRTKLNREGCLSEGLVLKYLQQLLPALDTAHKQSIWHLDIKPENIMVNKEEQVYLIDFGASKHIEQNSGLTTSLALAYTRGYCPPELADLAYGCQGNLIQALKEIGPWTDIYALGATMYNLLTESIPPSSNRLYRDGNKAFVFSDAVSLAIKELTIWMMIPNKEERPQNVEEIESWMNDRGLCTKNRFTLNHQESEGTYLAFSREHLIYDDEIGGFSCINAKPEILLDIYLNDNDTSLSLDIIDGNLISNSFVYYLRSNRELSVENISEAKKVSIGIIIIHLGWLMKEGKIDDKWSCYVEHTKTRISIQLINSYMVRVYRALSNYIPKSIEQISKESNASIEGTLLCIGWLMKEGKLDYVNNSVKLAW